MRIHTVTRAPVLAAAGLVVSLAVGGPAIAAALETGGAEPSGQPPAGAPAVTNPGPSKNWIVQPPAGAPAKSAGGVSEAASPNKQPPNLSPEKAGKPTQVLGPAEDHTMRVRNWDGARNDEGGAIGADLKGGRTDG